MSASVIAPVLEHLFHKCLINGVFPDSLKIGKIVPIHKKGPKNECCNYRPITLLSSGGSRKFWWGDISSTIPQNFECLHRD